MSSAARSNDATFGAQVDQMSLVGLKHSYDMWSLHVKRFEVPFFKKIFRFIANERLSSADRLEHSRTSRGRGCKTSICKICVIFHIISILWHTIAHQKPFLDVFYVTFPIFSAF